MPNPYDPNSPLPPNLQRIRKLLVSVFATGAALVTWLLSEPQSAVEIAGAVAAFVTTNIAVYETKNAG